MRIKFNSFRLVAPIVVLVLNSPLYAQVSLLNHVDGGPDGIFNLRDMAIGPDGTIYTTGRFNNLFTSDGVSITTENSEAIYLARYTSDLQLIWIHAISSSDDTTPLRSVIDVNSDGEIILGVSFRDHLINLEDTIVHPGEQAVQLMKLDQSADLVWSHTLSCQVLGKRGLVVDSDGDILVTGRSANGVYTAKYTSEGGLAWERNGGSNSSVQDAADFIDCDPEGNIFISGTLELAGNIYFDELHVPIGPQAWFINFLAKYDPDGSIQWVRYIYSETFAKFAIITGICALDNGSAVMAGWYDESILRFSNGLSSIGPNPSGHTAGYLACFNGAGDRSWAHKIHDNYAGDDGQINGLLNIGNNIILTDQFTGSIANGIDNYLDAGLGDILLEHYDATGTQLSSIQLGGAGIDIVNTISTQEESIYLQGGTTSHPFSISEDSFDSDHATSMYVVRVAYPWLNMSINHLDPVFRVYPNPCFDDITVQLPEATGQVSISDLQGRVVMDINPSHMSLPVSLASLAGGTYVLHYQNESGHIVGTVLIRKE